jgi:hypothetical protein
VPASLTGNWTGTANDSQGATVVAWSLTQSGNDLTGTVMTRSVNPNDGSCNSCHRNKSGSLTGILSDGTLTLRMFFAAGAAGDPTPACSATLTGTATSIGDGRLSGSYSGFDTCEGAFESGTLTMARQ